MARLPKRAAERVALGLKRFQPILSAARSRDVNESDTGLIVTDVLQEVFGYDKYSEITSEYQIRSSYCDLAIKLDGQLALLIEVKAVGSTLKDQHVKQAVDYAANQGTDWVVLTNGLTWQVYRVTFGKPVQNELVLAFDLLDLNSRSSSDVETLGLLAKEGWQKARLGEYHSQRQALSRFVLGALVVSAPVLGAIRRELRRMTPDVRITIEEIEATLLDDVLKRDVLEGENANAARKRVLRTARRVARRKKAAGDDDGGKPLSSGESLSQEARLEADDPE